MKQKPLVKDSKSNHLLLTGKDPGSPGFSKAKVLDLSDAAILNEVSRVVVSPNH